MLSPPLRDHVAEIRLRLSVAALAVALTMGVAEVGRIVEQLGIFGEHVVVVEFVACRRGAGRHAVVDALVADPAVGARVSRRVQRLALLEELGI